MILMAMKVNASKITEVSNKHTTVYMISAKPWHWYGQTLQWSNNRHRTCC